MSYESTIGNLSTYLMNMSSLGLYNNMTPMGYLPFSNVLSNALGILSLNDLNKTNITGFRTISADSALQKELNKLGYGNMMILIPEEYQKQVEENAENSQKIGETFKKWMTSHIISSNMALHFSQSVPSTKASLYSRKTVLLAAKSQILFPFSRISFISV